MTVQLRKVQEEEKPVLISLFNYYMYEFSDLTKSKLQANGSYLKDTELIDRYWIKANHYPYFIVADGDLAGFVFIRQYPSEDCVFDIDQFFVLKRFARLGIGSIAFKISLKLYPGNWVVRVMKENERGLLFWKSAIGAETKGDFRHSFELDEGVEMHFFRFRISR